MHKILLIEDSPEYTTLVQRTLGVRYAIQVASSLATARHLLKTQTFDLILLDVLLPDGDGFEFCSEIRAGENAKASIIFMSGKGEAQDRTMGWTLGADDYIVKPFSLLEFQARIQNRLEKHSQQKSFEGVVTWSELTMNLAFQEVTLLENGVERKLQLTPIEFKLLHCLMKNPDRILSRGQLIQAAWGPSVHITERTVDKHISIIRQKMNSTKTVIKTVSGMGYRLVKHASL